jgi:hypothetical protein
MKKSHIVLWLIVVCLCCIMSLQAVNPFAGRVVQATNHKDFPDPSDYIHTVINYYYAETEPALCDSINLTTQNVFNDQLETIYIHSDFEHIYQVVNGCPQVNYYEYRNHGDNLYAHYRFKWDANGDLIEVLQDRPDYDFFHIYLHYYNINQSDSILYVYGENPYDGREYYRMYYDADGRLTHSYRYLYDYGYETWNVYSRYVLTYGAEPYHYPQSLDISNYRFYVLNGGGFEDSNSAFDKNYAPETIDFDLWNGESWYPSGTSYYDVVPGEGEVALINGQYGNYYGRFIYNDAGVYVHKRVTYDDGSEVNYHLTWAGDVANDDPATPAATSALNVFPNPFRSNLNISLDDASKTIDQVAVYNLKGQLVRSWKGVKSSELTWDGRDNCSQIVSSGIYIIQAKQGRQITVSKAVKY